MSGAQHMLDGRRILLGISGSIAAYKSAALTRLLIKSGAEVKVVMTKAATDFITPLTLSTLSGHPVMHDLFSESGWHDHVAYGSWADAMVIAPATANTLSGMATGRCSNMLEATWLSARCPVFVAPAMDLEMWRHPTTQRNCAILEQDGVRIIPVGRGALASGLHGEGRMAEPEEIIDTLKASFQSTGSLQGKTVVITAGPTREYIDPVRFLSNPSTGKMGVALAESAASAGAEVHLILGPATITPSLHAQIRIVPVQTAHEMYEAAVRLWPQADIGIMCAAVSDWRPRSIATEKLKKNEPTLHLELERTPDIALELGRTKTSTQYLVGFALETERELDHAQDKLTRKNLDMIVLNSLRDHGAGFQTDTNKVTLIFLGGEVTPLPLYPKRVVADHIIAAIASRLTTDS
jgi:phosphopantothenoylcysteine decarboxylase/phosphopantothenate--cysteine ligase